MLEDLHVLQVDGAHDLLPRGSHLPGDHPQLLQAAPPPLQPSRLASDLQQNNAHENYRLTTTLWTACRRPASAAAQKAGPAGCWLGSSASSLQHTGWLL